MSTISPPSQTGQTPPEPAPTPEPAPEPEKDDGRDYIILKRMPSEHPNADPVFEQVATVNASSNDQAVRRAVELPGTSFLNTEGATTLVAIPSRSFSPVKVEVQVTRRVVVS